VKRWCEAEVVLLALNHNYIALLLLISRLFSLFSRLFSCSADVVLEKIFGANMKIARGKTESNAPKRKLQAQRDAIDSELAKELQRPASDAIMKTLHCWSC
jgi:hypothetical protein